MSGRIAIIAALPREIARLVRGQRADPSLLKRGIHLYRTGGGVVVAAGMGAERASLAVETALSSGDVTMLISAGLAGGCAQGVAAGSTLEAGTVVDVRTGERFTAALQPEEQSKAVVLATSTAIADVREKSRLLQSYDAAMVDMEAATVARQARAHELPFRAIKGISDDCSFELGSLSRFQGRHGSFRTGAFALHTAFAALALAKGGDVG